MFESNVHWTDHSLHRVMEHSVDCLIEMLSTESTLETIQPSDWELEEALIFNALITSKVMHPDNWRLISSQNGEVIIVLVSSTSIGIYTTQFTYVNGMNFEFDLSIVSKSASVVNKKEVFVMQNYITQ